MISFYFTEPNSVAMSPAPDAATGDLKPNPHIKRSATPSVDQSQGTPNPNLGTPNPMGTPNPQAMEVQVKEENGASPRDSKSTLNTVTAAALNPVQVGFGEILNCCFHRDVIIQLATILQVNFVTISKY